MIRILLIILLLIAIVYVSCIAYMYFTQERTLFFPTKLEKNYDFRFNKEFDELNYEVEPGVSLNCLLFKTTQKRKGLVIFIHGNTGNIQEWGEKEAFYTANGYDFFTFDYRGFGKSGGKVFDASHFDEDIQKIFNQLFTTYRPEETLLIGYSLGTYPATKMANLYPFRHLLLHAPYYSMDRMLFLKYPFVPTFLLKYHFRTCDYITTTLCPVTIFHGTADQTIQIKHGKWLANLLGPKADFVEIKDLDHNGFQESEVYQQAFFKRGF